MIRVIPFIFLFYGCSTLATDGSPPDGEEVFRLLLSNANISLKNEPLCNMTSVTKINGEMLLVDHLATVLSTSYLSKNTNTFASSCSKSKHETKDGKIIEIWDCNLQIKESSPDDEFISSSMVAFGISIDKSKFLPGTLRCF